MLICLGEYAVVMIASSECGFYHDMSIIACINSGGPPPAKPQTPVRVLFVCAFLRGFDSHCRAFV